MSWFFILTLLVSVSFYSCDQDATEEISASNLREGLSGAGNYDIITTTDGFSFTLEIDQDNAQDISHLVFQFTDCEGNYVNIDNYITATVNGMDWPLTSTTGSGTDCTFDTGDFVKFDDFGFEGGVVTVEFTLDVQVEFGTVLIKSGQGCYPFDIEGNCGDDEECVYTTESFDIFAGQTILVGELLVTNDEENLYVTYSSTSDDMFAETHLYVGALEDLPTNRKGTPVPGKFPYKTNHDPAVTSFTYTIPLADLPDCYIIAAHAAMTSDETAWSFGDEFEGTTRWGWTSNYCTQVCE
ncbi:hypothetical protein MY04_3775 [Flammeovirga sp. MY04]|uniref:hypothetical protein n=1 Tax=Flammeovirga sp. MY04 TaxID=1191459 RepID=UPI0013053EA4|nr:hypothetical protein [Flammeovirga sp. MY04]ANQ51119.2 hypothetical protein MY04_3775 [Flammeovirga sp. MY04]